MQLNYPKLRGKIAEKYGSSLDFARRLGYSPGTVSGKLNGKIEFSRSDIISWAEALDIPREQILDYFFTV